MNLNIRTASLLVSISGNVSNARTPGRSASWYSMSAS
jgi:hypothetical protein